MRLSICIIDKDSIRAETIKETLLDKEYHVEVFLSSDYGLKAASEGRFDVIFVDTELVDNFVDYIGKIKKFTPHSNIVALSASEKVDKILMLAELGIKYHLEAPIRSISSILNEVASIEADILKAEDKKNLFVSIVDDARLLLKSVLDKENSLVKRLSQNLSIAASILSPSQDAPNQLKGSFADFAYYDILRLLSSVYKEGILELKNDDETALVVIKNHSVISARSTSELKGYKAFMRIAFWQQGFFNFKSKIIAQYSVDTDLVNKNLIELCSIAKRTHEWFKLKQKNLPPKTLSIGLNVLQLKKDIPLNPQELEVMSFIVQYSQVCDILDKCNMPDADIYITIINLRRKGMLELRI